MKAVFNLMAMALLIETDKTVKEAWEKEGYTATPENIAIMKQLIGTETLNYNAKQAMKRIFKNTITGNKKLEKKYNSIEIPEPPLSGFFVANVIEMYDGLEFSDTKVFTAPNVKSINEAQKIAQEKFENDEDEDRGDIEVNNVREITREEYEVMEKYL